MIKEKYRINLDVSVYDLDISIERHNKEKLIDKMYDVVDEILNKAFPDSECTFSLEAINLIERS
jgi:hypothetical protein